MPPPPPPAPRTATPPPPPVRENNLYMKGVPSSLDEAALVAAVEAAVPLTRVLSARVLRGRGGESKGVAFVQVDSRAAADAVVAALHCMSLSPGGVRPPGEGEAAPALLHVALAQTKAARQSTARLAREEREAAAAAAGGGAWRPAPPLRQQLALFSPPWRAGGGRAGLPHGASRQHAGHAHRTPVPPGGASFRAATAAGTRLPPQRPAPRWPPPPPGEPPTPSALAEDGWVLAGGGGAAFPPPPFASPSAGWAWGGGGAPPPPPAAAAYTPFTVGTVPVVLSPGGLGFGYVRAGGGGGGGSSGGGGGGDQERGTPGSLSPAGSSADLAAAVGGAALLPVATPTPAGEWVIIPPPPGLGGGGWGGG